MALDLTGFGTMFEALKSGVGMFVADATERLKAQAKAEADARALAQKVYDYAQQEKMAEIELLKAQIDANKIQASSTNIFVAGARPAAMWVCVLGLIYNFLGYPFIRWGNAVFSWTNTPPELDNTTLTWLVAGLFGLTAARTYEKRKRVATSDFRSHPDDTHAPRALPVNKSPK